MIECCSSASYLSPFSGKLNAQTPAVTIQCQIKLGIKVSALKNITLCSKKSAIFALLCLKLLNKFCNDFEKKKIKCWNQCHGRMAATQQIVPFSPPHTLCLRWEIMGSGLNSTDGGVRVCSGSRKLSACPRCICMCCSGEAFHGVQGTAWGKAGNIHFMSGHALVKFWMQSTASFCFA